MEYRTSFLWKVVMRLVSSWTLASVLPTSAGIIAAGSGLNRVGADEGARDERVLGADCCLTSRFWSASSPALATSVAESARRRLSMESAAPGSLRTAARCGGGGDGGAGARGADPEEGGGMRGGVGGERGADLAARSSVISARRAAMSTCWGWRAFATDDWMRDVKVLRSKVSEVDEGEEPEGRAELEDEAWLEEELWPDSADEQLDDEAEAWGEEEDAGADSEEEPTFGEEDEACEEEEADGEEEEACEGREPPFASAWGADVDPVSMGGK